MYPSIENFLLFISQIFLEHEYSKRIFVPIIPHDDQDSEPKDFYVVLKDVCHDTMLGDPSIAHVSIVNDNG